MVVFADAFISFSYAKPSLPLTLIINKRKIPSKCPYGTEEIAEKQAFFPIIASGLCKQKNTRNKFYIEAMLQYGDSVWDK